MNRWEGTSEAEMLAVGAVLAAQVTGGERESAKGSVWGNTGRVSKDLFSLGKSCYGPTFILKKISFFMAIFP